MKIEIDLEKLYETVQFRKAAEKDSGLTIQVRQWGEMMSGHPDLPDELLLEQMRRTIESRIATFMHYAPDVSELKPGEMRIELDRCGQQKRVFGSFFYCSQIADYWEGQKTRAVEDARRSAHLDTLIRLQEAWLDECNHGEKRNWQRSAAKAVEAMLNREFGIDEDF